MSYGEDRTVISYDRGPLRVLLAPRDGRVLHISSIESIAFVMGKNKSIKWE